MVIVRSDGLPPARSVYARPVRPEGWWVSGLAEKKWMTGANAW
jgi:hypothetical protein